MKMGGIITNQDELVEILKGLFFDYIERRRTRQLYQDGKDGLVVPKRLLMFYYQLDENKRHLNQAADDFLRHYIVRPTFSSHISLKMKSNKSTASRKTNLALKNNRSVFCK